MEFRRKKGTLTKQSQAPPNPLVFDLVLRSIRCPRLLRTYRLVSKAWNESVCSVLRQNVAVSIHEDSKDEVTFITSLINHRRCELPSAFRKFRIVARDFTKLYFLQLLHDWHQDFIVTELELTQGLALHRIPGRSNLTQDKNYMKELHHLLTTHKDTLTTLDFLRLDFHVPPGSFDFQSIRLPNLKNLNLLFDRNFPSFYSLFVERVLLDSKLDVLKCSLTAPAPLFFYSLNFENVRILELSLSIYPFHGEHPLRSFTIIRTLPFVRTLRLFAYADLDMKQTAFELQPWTWSLQTLAILNVKFPLDHLSACPNLKEIRCGEFTGQFDPKKFPSLKSVRLSKAPDGMENFIPHFGVEMLTYGYNQPKSYSRYNWGQGFCDSLKILGKQFPLVRDFECRSDQGDSLPISIDSITTMQGSFPFLKRLCLNGTLTGLMNENGTHFGRGAKGLWSSFLELESLQVEHDVVVCPESIQYGLAKIPKLKHLKINHQKSLTPKTLATYLGHVKNLEVHKVEAETTSVRCRKLEQKASSKSRKRTK